MENQDIFWVIENCYTLGIYVCQARRLNEEEKKRFAEWYREYGMVSISGHGENALRFLRWDDCPHREPDGEFAGFGNQAWIISEEEANRYIALNAEREKETQKKELAEERAWRLQLLENAAKQGVLYTQEEARIRRQSWINVENEGGEGYVPHFYTIDEVENAKRWLQEHQE